VTTHDSMSCDVLVLGAGMAGLSAAGYAAEHGATVIVLERAKSIGGSALLSGGILWTATSRERMQLYGTGIPGLGDVVLRNYARGLEWLRRRGVAISPAVPVLHGRGYQIDILDHLRGCKNLVEQHGGHVALDTESRELLRNDNGAVTGARICHADGVIDVHAAATILATGGYQNSSELRAQHIHPNARDKLLLRTNPMSRGDGMRLAGFNRAFLGIETPVEESLKEAQKGQNLRHDLLESVKKIQSYGIEVMAGFIVGFDNDPDDIFDRMINFIKDSAIPLAMVGLLTALPNTQLWRRLNSEGRLLGESGGSNTHSDLNFVTRMDSARLVEGYKSILRSIYDTREYYDRALECLRRVSQTGFKSQRGTSFLNDLSALTRITLKLGVRDQDRWEFWRYLTQTLAHNRGAFADSMRLAAMGYHFRKLTETYCE